MRTLVVITSITLLCGCVSAPAPVMDAAAQAEKAADEGLFPRQPTPGERAACTARGGNIEPRGMLGSRICVVPYADGGKACSDGRDCIGECRYAPKPGERAPPQGKVVGQCESDDAAYFGCSSTVYNGEIGSIICVD